MLLVGVCIVVACQKEDEPEAIQKIYNPTPFVLEIPSSFPLLTILENNPMTVEGIKLGRMLFYEPILSGDNTLSCAGCHGQESSFGDTVSFSVGIDGLLGKRNSMPIVNAAWTQSFFWDGRASSLEDQARFPVKDPLEMHESWSHAVEELRVHPTYPDLFYEAFGTREIMQEHVTKAIAQFERTMISSSSRFDRISNFVGFFTISEANGFKTFNTEKGDCFHCHGTILLTDNLFHNNGLDALHSDVGLSEVSLRPSDVGKFKTPSLRNVALTAPYMHDGRFKTLEEVVDFYSEGLKFSETIDPLMKNVHRGGVQLTAEDKKDLIAFLHTFTDTSFLKNPDFANPFQ